MPALLRQRACVDVTVGAPQNPKRCPLQGDRRRTCDRDADKKQQGKSDYFSQTKVRQRFAATVGQEQQGGRTTNRLDRTQHGPVR